MLRGKKKYIAAALCLMLCFIFCGCTEKVEFQGGKLPVDATEITMVLQPGETALLDSFPGLTYADLSGSESYAEIDSWAKAHPQVELRYTISFPDGTVAENRARSLNLSALAAEDVSQAAELLPYLGELEELILMPGKFSAQDVARLSQAAGGLEVEYSFELCGQSVDIHAQSLDLSALQSSDLAAALEILPGLPELESVNLGTDQPQRLGWDDIYALIQACPDVDFEYAFSIYGKSFSLSDKIMDLNHIQLGDNGAQAYSAARCMKKLEYLDMDFCGVPNEVMEQIRDGLPGVKVVWRIWFGSGYSVRTDVEKILASKPSEGGNLRDADTQVLKYCTDLKYLDLGHNLFLTDVSFVAHMPKLEVAVLAMNEITDISAFASCPELEYLEIQTNENLADISPLANCKKLAHLNVARCRYISDISPLYELDKLERFWLGSGSLVPAEQLEEFRQRVPDCELNTLVFSDPTGDGWRAVDMNLDTWQPINHPRYTLLQEQFGYLEEAYSFSYKDPKYEAGWEA